MHQQLAKRIVASLDPKQHYQVCQELNKRSLARPLYEIEQKGIHLRKVGVMVPIPFETETNWKVQYGEGSFQDYVDFSSVFHSSTATLALFYVSPWVRIAQGCYAVYNGENKRLACIQPAPDAFWHLNFPYPHHRASCSFPKLNDACNAASNIFKRVGKIVHWPEIFSWVK